MVNSSTAYTVPRSFRFTPRGITGEPQWLDKPSSEHEARLKGNLAHQMAYSVEELERQLVELGCPHVLQLELTGGSRRAPEHWRLYVDGFEVAHGPAAYALECFVKGPGEFRDDLRKPVLGAQLPELSEREYYLLCRARDIAQHAEAR